MRSVVLSSIFYALLCGCGPSGSAPQADRQPPAAPRQSPVDLIVHNAKITAQDPALPDAAAIAIAGEKVVVVGSDADILKLRGEGTKVIDAGGRRMIPGLNDSHLHATRQGRFYNCELRWDGVASLSRGFAIVREQAERTPRGQ